ncbi:hypothetical protein [Diaphorobacter sp. J5-51]|uniref:hypothetical protein n=1 Tax=Diaphorobacter sp. J5-51 TaxID=680496 RepID=UPI0012F9A671|nr:hypothetical protein [Diaphorobacter sp. J5-51]
MDFEAWWNQHGQFCRAGGGDYEKTFAFRAWEAAVNMERKACAEICRSDALKMEQEALQAIENGEHDEVSSLRSTAWRLTVAANAIGARAG